MTDTPTGSFAVPSNTKFGPYGYININLPDAVAKEVHRGISMLVEQSVQLNEWGLSALIELLVPFVNLAHLPPTTLRHPNFYRLLFVNQPIFFHQLLYLAILFPDVYAPDTSLIITRLIMMMRDILLPPEQRMLVINWLLSLTRPEPSPYASPPYSPPLSSSSTGMPSPPSLSPTAHVSPPVSPPFTPNSSTSGLLPFTPLPPLLHEHFRAFYPTVFDSLDLKEAKLHALLKCFANEPPSAAPPKNILEVLFCLDDFRFFSPTRRPVQVVFSILFRTLTRFPHLLDSVYDFILHTILKHPHFLDNVIRLINALEVDYEEKGSTGMPQNVTSPLVLRMLQRFEAVLCSLPPRKLEPYLGLAERIVMEYQIEPTGILVALRQYLRAVAAGQWAYGQMMLSIARWAMLRHQKLAVFKPLGELLSFLAVFYPDIEIRDRAQFYLLMLTHLPTEKITLVLTQKNTPTDEENVGFVSPFVPKTKTVKSLPKFLALTRIYVEQPNTSIELNSEFVNPETQDPYIQYTTYVNSPSFSVVINIPFELSYKYPPLNEVFPKKVYALLVQFSPTQSFETLAPLRIPYLALTEDLKPTTAGFPYLYKLVLKFKPKFPIPTSFAVKTLFNDGDGKTCKGEIEPMSVNFQDLYMEVPIPPFVTTPKEEFLRILFNRLWKDSNGKSNPESIKSVKFIEISHAVILKSIETGLKRFLISESDKPNGLADKEQAKDKQQEHQQQEQQEGGRATATVADNLEERVFVCEKRALLFLPTKFHLLLKFQIYEDQTLVKIRTDFWKTLSFIDAFFSVTLAV